MASDLWSGAVFRRAKGVSFGRPRLVNEKLQTGAIGGCEHIAKRAMRGG